mmetsp:Transcript_13153/g.31090  ORF Transcript_13153/g.31090 Transcript_13153/m.31090 type:complete len:408 (+) Transcript_13153:289-1512(+)
MSAALGAASSVSCRFRSPKTLFLEDKIYSREERRKDGQGPRTAAAELVCGCLDELDLAELAVVVLVADAPAKVAVRAVEPLGENHRGSGGGVSLREGVAAGAVAGALGGPRVAQDARPPAVRVRPERRAKHVRRVRRRAAAQDVWVSPPGLRHSVPGDEEERGGLLHHPPGRVRRDAPKRGDRVPVLAEVHLDIVDGGVEGLGGGEVIVVARHARLERGLIPHLAVVGPPQVQVGRPRVDRAVHAPRRLREGPVLRTVVHPPADPDFGGQLVFDGVVVEVQSFVSGLVPDGPGGPGARPPRRVRSDQRPVLRVVTHPHVVPGPRPAVVVGVAVGAVHVVPPVRLAGPAAEAAHDQQGLLPARGVLRRRHVTRPRGPHEGLVVQRVVEGVVGLPVEPQAARRLGPFPG